MTPFSNASTSGSISDAILLPHETPDEELNESTLITILFYPDGKKREFDYDQHGALRGIDHGDGSFWLRSEEGGGWFVFSETMSTAPVICLYNVRLNQSTGALHYQTDSMNVTELPTGERLTERLSFEAA